MIVLEKWNPNKPISAIYWEGEKERFYVKRFLIETELKEELFISEHAKSYLELVSTQWRPVIEIEFPKPRGKEAKENLSVDIEDFISVKGIKAMGNQLITEKVKNVNLLDPLPYEEPVAQDAADMEVIDEENVDSGVSQTTKPETDEGEEDNSEGQTKLF